MSIHTPHTASQLGGLAREDATNGAIVVRVDLYHIVRMCPIEKIPPYFR